jgi:endonuclease/exonuclease/phosphatase family metal-dependent hydrolase
MRLRIATLNIQNTDGDPARIGIINRGLRELKPDLLALQEVVQTAETTQLVPLLDGTGLTGTHQADVMATTPPGAARYGGNAIATRWPHRIVEVLDLRLAGAADVPWCTLAARVPIPNGDELLFIGTTTAWRLEAEAARERQVVALTDLDARHRGKLPTIMAGDFNAAPQAASIRYLTGLQSLFGRSVLYHDAWAVAGDGPGHTWAAGNPNADRVFAQILRQPNHQRRIDYVFVGAWHAHPDARCEIRSARLAFDQPLDGLYASDHFGVVVDVEIGAG